MKWREFIPSPERYVLSLWPVLAMFTLISVDALAQSRCLDLFTKYPTSGFHYTVNPSDLRQNLSRLRLYINDREAQDSFSMGKIEFSQFRLLDTPTAKLLRDFQNEWGVELFYQNRFSTSEAEQARQQIIPKIMNGNRVSALRVPVELLLNYQLLYSKLSILKDTMVHARRIESLGGEIQLMSQGDVLILTIDKVAENSTDPLLRLIGQRQKRWGLSFTFSDGLIDSTLVNAAGYASGKRIVLRSDYLSSEGRLWLTDEGVSVIAHEIIHGATAARWARYRASNPDLIDNGRMIEFRPLDSENILSEILPEIYRKYFRSDEVEAYGIEAYFSLKPAKSLVNARRFLIQLKWLNEALKRIETHVSPPLVTVRGSKVKILLAEAVIEIPYVEPIPLTPERLQNDLRRILQNRIQQLVNFDRILPALVRRTHPEALDTIIDPE